MNYKEWHGEHLPHADTRFTSEIRSLSDAVAERRGRVMDMQKGHAVALKPFEMPTPPNWVVFCDGIHHAQDFVGYGVNLLAFGRFMRGTIDQLGITGMTEPEERAHREKGEVQRQFNRVADHLGNLVAVKLTNEYYRVPETSTELLAAAHKLVETLLEARRLVDRIDALSSALADEGPVKDVQGPDPDLLSELAWHLADLQSLVDDGVDGLTGRWQALIRRGEKALMPQYPEVTIGMFWMHSATVGPALRQLQDEPITIKTRTLLATPSSGIDELRQWLTYGTADVVLGGPSLGKGFESVKVYETNLVAFAEEGHPVLRRAKRGSLPVRRLFEAANWKPGQVSLLVMAKGFFSRTRIEQHRRALHPLPDGPPLVSFDAARGDESSSVVALTEFALAGRGVAVFSADGLGSARDGMVVKLVDDDGQPITLEVCAHYRSDLEGTRKRVVEQVVAALVEQGGSVGRA